MSRWKNTTRSLDRESGMQCILQTHHGTQHGCCSEEDCEEALGEDTACVAVVCLADQVGFSKGDALASFHQARYAFPGCHRRSDVFSAAGAVRLDLDSEWDEEAVRARCRRAGRVTLVTLQCRHAAAT